MCARPGDFKVVFTDYDMMGGDDKMFHFCMHTAFIRRESYRLPKVCVRARANRVPWAQDTCRVFLHPLVSAHSMCKESPILSL